MKLSKRLFWRFLAGLGVLWGAATVTFFAVHITGGDIALSILGGAESMPPAHVLEQLRKDYGLNDPLIVQYTRYLGRIVHGDLGESYKLRIPVTRAIGEQFGATLQLALCGALLAVVLSIVVATFTARRSRWVRSLSSGTELVLSSTPQFVLGVLLLLAFAFRFRLFPASGMHGWKSLVLPTLTVALPMAAMLTQVLRNELEDILEQPFITTARARGMSDAGVRLLHALRHALIPLVTLSGFLFASLFSNAVITETLFSRQGVGRLMVEATSSKDVPLVLGITLLAAAAYVTVNFVVDLVYPLIDPRVTNQ